MTNKVIAGRFAGKRIRNDDGAIYIPLSNGSLYLTPEIVSYIRVINTIQNKNFLSGLLRGLPAKLLGNTAWISAIQSAKYNYYFNIKITYRNGENSVAVVDFQTFEQFASIYEIY